MADFYKVLATADLPVLGPPPMLMSPLSGMRTFAELPVETLIYEVPEGRQTIIKMIVCTSDQQQQSVTMRCYSDGLPAPLFGPVNLGPGEWAEWSGSLTLSGGAQIVGAISGGLVSVAVYGMERTI